MQWIHRLRLASTVCGRREDRVFFPGSMMVSLMILSLPLLIRSALVDDRIMGTESWGKAA